MQSKSLLIAIAAFAVTTTGVSAYGNSNLLKNRAGLNEEQVSAIEEAHELKQAGKLEAARDKLVEAGIDDRALLSVHRANHGYQSDIHAALENEDYEAFIEAIAGSPLADIITSEEDFEQFLTAHKMRADGEWKEAHEIMEDLGFESDNMMHGRPQRHYVTDFTDEQQEALRAARQANDRTTIQAIFDEAGVEHHHHRGHGW